MKKKLILMLLITLTLSFSSCGSKTPSEETEGVVETTVVSTSEATETPEPASKESVVYTPDPTPTSTPTPTPTPSPTASPTSDPSLSSEYVMSEELKQDLKTLGATDDEINNIKSEKDMTDLVDKLITGGGNNSSSSTTGGSSSSDTGSSGATGDGNDNDLPIFELGSGDTVQGSM